MNATYGFTIIGGASTDGKTGEGVTARILIENNECSRSVEQHGIYFSNSADRPVIRGNRVWGNASAGIHMNGDVDTGDTSLPGDDGIISGAPAMRTNFSGIGDQWVAVMLNQRVLFRHSPAIKEALEQ